MGRPSKLDDEEALDRYFKALNAGVSPEVAARYGGFSPASMYRYKRGPTARHAAFRERYEQSLAGLEMRLSGVLLVAAQTDPRWALILLERRFPKRWARQRIDDSEEQVDRMRPAPEAPIVLDPAFLNELVPKLLEAGRKLSGRPETIRPDISAFVDDGIDHPVADGDTHGTESPAADGEAGQ